jgi:hypothetical protein
MLLTTCDLHHKEGVMLSKAGTHHRLDLDQKEGVVLSKAGTYTSRLDLHHKAGLTHKEGLTPTRMDLCYRRRGLTPRETASYLISCFVTLRYPCQGDGLSD